MLAERLRQGIENCDLSLPNGKRLHITASIGVSAVSSDTDTAEAKFTNLIESADLALYEAKKQGRNRVEVDGTAKGTQQLTESGSGFGYGVGGLAQLIWSDHFRSGNQTLDCQHRKLFDDINKLFSAILSERSGDEVGAAVDALMRAMVSHFQDEERLLLAIGYPQAAEHAALHGVLIHDADELVECFRNGSLDIGALFQFLASALVAKHILSEDRDFFPYLDSASG